MNLRTITLILGAAALGGCAKGEIRDITAPITGARVKFFNFAVAAAPTATPAVNFYANDTKVTAVTSTDTVESTNGTASGSAGNGGFYSMLPAGQYSLTGRIASATDKGVAVTSVPAALAEGKLYSMYLSGNYNATTKSSDGFVVEDPLPDPVSPALSYVRFVNASANLGPATVSVMNSTGGAEVAVGGAVSYKSAGAFVTVPEGSYNITVRLAGTTSSFATRTAVSLLAGRVYTVGVFGDATVSGTTAANRLRLDVTPNR